MDILYLKSLRENPPMASSKLAPIEVEQRNNCFPKTNSLSSYISFLQSETIFKENSNDFVSAGFSVILVVI
jgi:hypothetical protein